MPADVALGLLSLVSKQDGTFIPVKDSLTRRWHVRTARGEFEILTTGIKWYDTRAQCGGGGAIDLAIHLLGLSFVDAVKHLVAKEQNAMCRHPLDGAGTADRNTTTRPIDR